MTSLPSQQRQAFSEQLLVQVQQIESAWSCAPILNLDPAALGVIQQLAHKIAGTALTLGFLEVGQIARDLEQIAVAQLNNPAARSIENRIVALKQAAASLPLVPQADPEASMKETLKGVASLQDTRSALEVYLVEDDPLQAQELVAQLMHFGYQVQSFNQLATLRDTLEKRMPAAILMDIVFPEGDTAGVDVISGMRDFLPPDLPVIFISVREDMPSRLQVVRAGGQAYFTKPIDISSLVDTLDELLIEPEALPYRILIIDDSQVQAGVNAMHLRKAGMQVEIVSDPMQVLEALAEFNPDLILLDMYMPECSGTELARVIRQAKAFVHVPIVFLSAETDREKQLEAVGLGGDDFLTKPIRPAHLVSATTSRVERYRQLHFLMVRDSLTGLYNHTTLKERLNQEIALAERQGIPLAYAMLDLDHFKSVNDTYGHAVGDRVLKSLARLLVKRLRKSDIIGRYGGEEFAIVFPNTTALDATQILEDIRQNFSGVHHLAGEQEFSVTFSCGLAEYPSLTTAASLSNVADRALYQAKAQGRNCVVRI